MVDSQSMNPDGLCLHCRAWTLTLGLTQAQTVHPMRSKPWVHELCVDKKGGRLEPVFEPWAYIAV